MSDLNDLLQQLVVPRPFPIEQAACRGIDTRLFFPERGEDTTIAKRICTSCPVRTPCRDWALANGERFGIWGGTSERERRNSRRHQRTTAIDQLTQAGYAHRVALRRARNGAA